MPLWIWPVVALFLGYLLGSIPFGVVLTRAFGAGDIRQIGSGNIGATNVLRTGRKGLAAATLILDALKAVAAVLIARAMTSSSGSELELIAAAGAFFGHLYPVWLKFKGGKGVATLLGLCLILDWRVGLIFALAWLGGDGGYPDFFSWRDGCRSISSNRSLCSWKHTFFDPSLGFGACRVVEA